MTAWPSARSRRFVRKAGQGTCRSPASTASTPLIQAIEAGEMAGTVAWDPNWTGGMGLSIGYHSAIGEIDIASEPQEHREFYGTGIIVTPETVDDFKSMDNTLDYKDFWGKATGQIQYR